MRLDDKIDLHIKNITVEQAREIAELLGNGAVVWSMNKCFPDGESECEILTHNAQSNPRSEAESG